MAQNSEGRQAPSRRGKEGVSAEVEGMRVLCLECGKRYDVRRDQLRCPHCGANRFRLVRRSLAR